MISRRRFLTLSSALPLGLVVAHPLRAATPPTFQANGVAINGIDPVGYFTKGGPVAGSPDWALMWNGATWLFSVEENRVAFEADPYRFAPRYGGYCAYAVSKGATAPTDPEAWTIHEDRLYLNYSEAVRDIWREDIPGNVELADANWPSVLGL